MTTLARPRCWPASDREFADPPRTIDPVPRGAVGAPPRIRVLAIPGSLRDASYNRMLLDLARSLAPPHVEIVLWDGLKAVEPFDQDDEATPPPGVQALRSAIAGADALLVATPEYNSSLPGQLKNAFDWASRPRGACVLDGKLVAVIGASPGRSGAGRAQADARKVLTTAGADVIQTDLALARANAAFDERGQLYDPKLAERLATVVSVLAASASAARAAARAA